MIPDSATQSVLDHWFSASARKYWFNASEDFDRDLVRRFSALHRRAANGELDGWESTATGSLALVILLDQCSRNFNRNRGDAYANDAHARRIVLAAIARGFDQELEGWRRAFLYMPLMHSEAPDDQDYSVRLFTEAGLDNARYALHHRDIIRRFGRFPHRNKALGRESTADEIAYLKSEGAFHG
ncbi:MAG: DUF924 domain-containing protein [Gammaproteobacteria bacterium]|nr:DUF924 domain-containing protein [Gammaproteobacteria bacterium]